MKTIIIVLLALVPVFQVSAETTYYPNKYYNYDESGNVTKHIFVGDMDIATITYTATSTGSTTPVTNYIHTDHLGGTAVTTSATGTLQSQTDYYPYGAARLDEGTGLKEQRKFTGHEFDENTGFTYMKARYYDGSKGQFLSQDPSFLNMGAMNNRKQAVLLSDPQQMNSYSYARNNPILNIDPDGKESQNSMTMFSGWNKNAFSFTGSAANYFNQNIGNPTKQFVTNALNFSPGIGDVKSGMEAFSGKDTITGGTLTNRDRLMSALSSLPIAGIVGDAGKVVFKNMNMIESAEAKLNKLSIQFGKPASEILDHVQQNGKPFLDNVSGNINYFAEKLNDAKGYVRITVEPTFNRIISAGQNTVRNITNGLEKGRYTKIK